MRGDFVQATAVARANRGGAEVDPTQPGAVATYDGEIVEGWDIEGHANGGYLAAIVGRAIQHWLNRPLLSVSSHYLAPGIVGPVRIEVATVRSGKTHATVSAGLWQGSRQLVQTLATLGRPPAGGFSWSKSAPPPLDAFDDDSFAVEPDAATGPALASTVDLRLSPSSRGFRSGQPSGEAEVTGWFGFRQPTPIDDVALLLIADAFPPPIFNLDHPVRWVPTVEMTVYVRAVAAPGPLRCRFVSEHIGDGLVVEDGEIWDRDGRLVGESRQLALVPRSP